MDEREEILTVDEIDSILMAIFKGQGAAGTMEDDWGEVIAWAHKTRINNALLDLVLNQQVMIQVEDGGGFRFVAKEFATPPTR